MIPDTRCTNCGLESRGKEVCDLCANPRPRTGDHVTREWTVRIDQPGRYLVSLFADGGATVALANGDSRWHAAQDMTEMAL